MVPSVQTTKDLVRDFGVFPPFCQWSVLERKQSNVYFVTLTFVCLLGAAPTLIDRRRRWRLCQPSASSEMDRGNEVRLEVHRPVVRVAVFVRAAARLLVVFLVIGRVAILLVDGTRQLEVDVHLVVALPIGIIGLGLTLVHIVVEAALRLGAEDDLLLAALLGAGTFTLMESWAGLSSTCRWGKRRLSSSGLSLPGMRVMFMLNVESTLSRTNACRAGSKYSTYWSSSVLRGPVKA
ncbi:hypothetical protein BM221_004978 [Beauveria bassiana]|uniref:Uncharacterized protein n=1 Tax=Beauveria bassiana TaxID=176275 RepID=A0A2N6NMA5_BEABA|nr:hypothetical protein BM221_004978 [Beauveria bassiana]